MSKWCYQVTMEDGAKYESVFDTPEAANASAAILVETSPELVVGEVTAQADDYVPLAPVSQTVKADGSTDVLYNDGSVVNVPAS